MKNDNDKEYLNSLTKTQEEQPQLYQVMLHNDDFTPMEFIASVMEKFFYKDRREATDILLEVRMKGKALCGVFSKDFAESKISQVVEYAQSHEHPLLCSMEAV